MIVNDGVDTVDAEDVHSYGNDDSADDDDSDGEDGGWYSDDDYDDTW